MAHVAIAGDLHGTLYLVDHEGHLHWNTHRDEQGTGPLVHAGVGERLAGGWQGIRHLTAVRVDALTALFAIGPSGELVGSCLAGKDARDPTPIDGAATEVRRVFAGARGSLYSVTRSGALVRQSVGASPGQVPTLGPVETVESAGWGRSLALFDNGDGFLFDVTLNGQLRCQDLRGSGAVPAAAQWKPISGGWSRYHTVFGAGRGGLYALGAEGALEHRLYIVNPDGSFTMAPRHLSPEIASGLFPWAGLAADVEGYCWPMSVTAGESVDVMVGVRVSVPPTGVPTEVADPVHYTVGVCRLRRWHNGQEQNVDTPMPTGLTAEPRLAGRYAVMSDLLSRGAGWTSGFTVQVPVNDSTGSAWRSGVYAARLTDRAGRDYYAPFIVRPARPQSPFCVLANTNTWNAYNSWGGQGKYTHTHPLPSTLPFQRPHPGLTPDIFWQTPDAEFLPFGPSILTNSCHLLRAELWVLGWLEDLGPAYAYDMYTDQDLHDGRTGLGDGDGPAYKALILNTHPEYWTRQMYDRTRRYLDQGGSIIYLGGNGVYEEVVLSEDRQHMRIFPGIDLSRYPSYVTNEQVRLSCLMRSPAVGRPEHALFGVGFQNCTQANALGQAYHLAQDPASPDANPVLRGLTIAKGAALGATSNDVTPPAPKDPSATYMADGWEVDQRGAGTPPQAFATESLLAIGKHESLSGEMLCYETDQGGVVFAAASLNFGGSMVVDPNLQRMVQNALDLCLER